MKISRINSFFVALAFLIIVSNAGAQFKWKITHADHDSLYAQYSFTALSCSGENCTVAGLRWDTLTPPRAYIDIVFWRSTDGGSTWVVQNPGLPIEAGQNQNQFYHIQQIDSLNVVAIGDTGLILRTFDGGATWEKQDCNSSAMLLSVHFSDSLTGILTTADTDRNILTTSDGGRHWIDVAFSVSNAVQSHSYGGGKFRVFADYYGPIYTTFDNWQTLNSTNPFVDWTVYPFSNFVFYSCNFSGGDTILVYGAVFGTTPTDGLIMRSLDGGQTWDSAFSSIFYRKIVRIDNTTSLDRDLILGGGEGGDNDFIISTDRGKSWIVDSLIYADSQFYHAYSCRGIAMTSSDKAVAIYSSIFLPLVNGTSGIIIHGERSKSSVEAYEYYVNNTFLYPNPVTKQLNISSNDISRPIHIYDMLGREVIKGMLSDQGKATFNTSRLPSGIYTVLLEHIDKMLPVGKIAVLKQ
jgi:photosystem II stability/assembly factor-like uncharacterized protein